MSATDGATPVVSVCMITYNHERFIAQAIESVLMQETDFPVELVIGEDCSTDSTRAIVVEYAQRHPDRIRPLLRERNMGMIPNFVATLQACRGKYIALLEGDDYWTDPHKLQKQVEFLEGHPECSLCLHDVLVVHENQTRPSYRHHPPAQRQFFDLEDVLVAALSQTASLVFRADALPDFPAWFYRTSLGDWALSVLLAEKGRIGYLREIMSVWRNHERGVWNGIPEHRRLTQTLEMYDLLDLHFEHRFIHILEPARVTCYYGLALDCWLNEAYEEQDRWMKLVIEKFPKTAAALSRKVVDSAHQVESLHGLQKAEAVIDWTCNTIKVLPGGETWCNRLRSEWYAGIAFKAYQTKNWALVHPASCRAVRYDPQILKNRGFLIRWLQALKQRTISMICSGRIRSKPDARTILRI